jgi:hypothetical protein
LTQKDYFGGFCMKNWKHFMLVAFLAIFGIIIAFIACDNGVGGNGRNDPQKEIPREFTIKMWDKDIIVKDTRSGTTDKNLSELKVIEKLEGAIVELDAAKDEPSAKSVFDNVLANGMIIIVEKLTAPYNGFRTKADGKTIMFDIDYISKTGTTKDDIANDLYDAVMDYLSKGLAKTAKVFYGIRDTNYIANMVIIYLHNGIRTNGILQDCNCTPLKRLGYTKHQSG